MNYAIIDSRTPYSVKDALIREGIGLIPLPAFKRLSEPVAAHPDMLLFLGDSVICHREYYAVAKDEIDEISRITGLPIELSDEEINEKYPGDVLFNAATVGGRIVCRPDSCSKLIKSYAERSGKTIRAVRQGYSKCSLLAVTPNAVITADKGLAGALDDVGVLLIAPGGIRLDGCNYGFIGGASGIFEDRVYFSGRLEFHPEGEKIADFCKRNGMRPLSLGDEPLCDVGTMFFI